MVRIIDMECTVPKPGGEGEGGSTGAYGSGGNAPAGALEQPKGYGMANYARIFKGRAEGKTQAQVALDEYVEMLGVRCCDARDKRGEIPGRQRLLRGCPPRPF